MRKRNINKAVDEADSIRKDLKEPKAKFEAAEAAGD